MVRDDEGRLVLLLLTEGQQSNQKGALTLLPKALTVAEMMGCKGYDSHAYRVAWT